MSMIPGTGSANQFVTPTPTAGSASGVGIPIPADIAKRYDIKPGTTLWWNSGNTNVASHPPVTGKELYEAIGQAKIPNAAKEALIAQSFGAGFSPTEKDASKVFTAVTENLGYTNYNLAMLHPPTVSQLSSSVVVNPGLSPQNGTRTATLGVSNPSALSQESAYGVVSNYLETWGLQQDAPYVYQMITRAGDHVVNTDAVLNAVRGNTPSGLGPKVDEFLKTQYDNAFPGLEQYNNQKGAIHMTEGAYQTYSQTVMNSATQFGAPMPSQREIGTLLNGHTSAAEYQQRVQDIYAAVKNADAGTKQILQHEFGINQKDLFAYYANPKNALPEMQRKIASAEIQDYANRVGLPGVGERSGNQLGDMAKLSATQGNTNLGYGVSQIENSLLTASKGQPLTASNPGAANPTVNTNTLIGAQLAGFGGQNQRADQVAVERAAQAKVAPFERGGGPVSDARGVIGSGSAST